MAAKPVEEWKSNPDSNTANKYIYSLAVVNAGAERCVKLSRGLIDRTEDEDQLQVLARLGSIFLVRAGGKATPSSFDP